MNQALSALSLRCSPTDARRALYLMTAPSGEMTVDMIKQISSYLKNTVPEAIIRGGDYPRGKTLDITVILSELINSRKVMDYFTKTIDHLSIAKRRRGEIEHERTGIEGNISDIPSLL